MRMTFLAVCLVGLFLFSSSAAEARNWTICNGVCFEAEFVRLEQCIGKGASQIMIVVFRRTDGLCCAVRLTTLSVSDQVYVIRLLPPPPDPVLPQPAKPIVPPPPTPLVQPTPPPRPAPIAQPVRLYYRPRITPVTENVIEIIERMREAKRRFQSVLSEFPAESLSAQVVGDSKPVEVKDHKVTFTMQVRLGADEMRMGRFLKDILLAMEDFQEYHWEEGWLFAPVDKGNLEYVRTGMQGESKTVTEDTTVYVNTEKNVAWTSLKWKASVFNPMLTDVFSDAARRRCECVVSIVTKGGDTIPVDRFPLDAERIGGSALITETVGHANGGSTFFISPTFIHEVGCSKYAPTATVSRNIKIEESMLDRLAGFKCKVQFVPGGNGGG